MANVTYRNCYSVTPNTGVAKCNIDPGLLQGFIMVPKGTRYTAAQLPNIVALLATAAQTNPPQTRVYPIGPFINVTDNSTDTVTESTDYGYTEIVRDGIYAWMGRTGYGGDCLYRSLRKFQGKQDMFDFIGVFKNQLLMTYAPNLTTGAPEYKGISPSLIRVPNFKIAVGNTATQFWIEIQVFDAGQISDNFAFIQTDVSPLSNISGITNVDIQNNATFNTSPAGSVDILPVVECDGSSLVTTYGNTWNNALLWTATNDATGAGITITGVSTVNGKYRLQLDTTDPDYPAVNGKIRISGGTVSALNAAGIIGYETNTAVVTRTV